VFAAEEQVSHLTELSIKADQNEKGSTDWEDFSDVFRKLSDKESCESGGGGGHGHDDGLDGPQKSRKPPANLAETSCASLLRRLVMAHMAHKATGYMLVQAEPASVLQGVVRGTHDRVETRATGEERAGVAGAKRVPKPNQRYAGRLPEHRAPCICIQNSNGNHGMFRTTSACCSRGGRTRILPQCCRRQS